MTKLRLSRSSYNGSTENATIGSTTFFLDGTGSDPAEFTYLTRLAGIAAYAVPIESGCNNFYLVNYYGSVVFAFQ